jgi:RNA binding exosome subunit
VIGELRKVLVLGLLLLALTLSGCGGGSSKPDEAAIVGNLASQFLTTFVQAEVSSVQGYFANPVYWTVTYVDLYHNTDKRTFTYSPYQCQQDYLDYQYLVDLLRAKYDGYSLYVSWDRTVRISGGAATVTGVATITESWSGGSISTPFPISVSLVKQGSTWFVNAVDWDGYLIYKEIGMGSTEKRVKLFEQRQ